jgi:hypothetical protein
MSGSLGLKKSFGLVRQFKDDARFQRLKCFDELTQGVAGMSHACGSEEFCPAPRAPEHRIKCFRLPHHNLSLLRCLLALVTQLPLP